MRFLYDVLCLACKRIYRKKMVSREDNIFVRAKRVKNKNERKNSGEYKDAFAI